MSASYVFEPAESYRDARAQLVLDGPQDIFRLMVNLLSAQVEFHDLARGVLVELREHLKPQRFDPMAESLLGTPTFKAYSSNGYFQRDDHCCACEKRITARMKRWPAGGHRAFCFDCHKVYGKAAQR